MRGAFVSYSTSEEDTVFSVMSLSNPQKNINRRHKI